MHLNFNEIARIVLKIKIVKVTKNEVNFNEISTKPDLALKRLTFKQKYISITHLIHDK